METEKNSSVNSCDFPSASADWMTVFTVSSDARHTHSFMMEGKEDCRNTHLHYNYRNEGDDERFGWKRSR